MLVRKAVFSFILPLISSCVFSQGTWVQKANFPGVGRWQPASFSIGNKGYFGLGGSSCLNDFWMWDQGLNSWTQKANFPGVCRAFPASFSVSGQGYCGSGVDASSNGLVDWWKYDPLTNSWTQIANHPGVPVLEAFSFIIGSKAYVGTGGTTELWEYDSGSNLWIQKANCPVSYIAGGVDKGSFSLGAKGYFIGSNTNDFWEWDQITNSWAKKSPFPGGGRVGSIGFALNCEGYIGTGWDFNSGSGTNDLWKWIQVTDTWIQDASLPTTAFGDAGCFAIGGKGYVVGGSGFNNKFWEFSPQITGPVIASITASSLTICSGESVSLIASGGNLYNWNTGSTSSVIVIAPPNTTSFSVIITDLCSGNADTAFATIAVIPTPTISLAPSTVICTGDSMTLAPSTTSANFLWSTGATSASIVVSPTISTSYSVVASNSSCSDTGNILLTVIQPGVSQFTYQYEPCTDNCVKFTNQSSNAYNWCWEMGDGGISSVENPCWQYTVSSTYYPSLVINCNTSCADTFSISLPYTISDTASTLFIPNAFSPNGDEENDVLAFQIKDNSCISKFEITIFNQWGEKVFETTTLGNTWDGTYIGEQLKSQVFSYYCKTTTTTGRQVIRKGNIALIK